MARIRPDLLSLAGEYRVCSELNKRGLFATVTYGNRKSVDVYVIQDAPRRAIRVEVKTSQRGRFVTRITQKRLEHSADAPDYWVLFLLRPRPGDEFEERFFVLSHREICRIQKKGNSIYARRYRKTHGKSPDEMAGVDNVRVEDVQKYENAWEKILRRGMTHGPLSSRSQVLA